MRWWTVVARRRSGRGAILMYHRVDRAERDFWGLAVDPARFDQHLELLQARYRPTGLLELDGARHAGRGVNAPVAVTFDDGYRDNLLVAKALLERHDVPATVFALAGSLETGRALWWDELELVCFGGALPGPGRLEVERFHVAWEAGAPDEVCRALHGQLRVMPHDLRLAALDRLRALVAVPGGSPATLSAEELVELARGELVTIGAHTVTHPSLPSLSPAEARTEIRTGRERLQEILGEPVATFSYPFGDHDAASVEIVRELGFARAVTAEARPVTRASDPLALPRLYVGDWSAGDLEERLERLLAG